MVTVVSLGWETRDATQDGSRRAERTTFVVPSCTVVIVSSGTMWMNCMSPNAEGQQCNVDASMSNPIS